MELYPGLGIALLVIGLLCSTLRSLFFGIPPLILEGAGLAIVASWAGYHLHWFMLIILLAGSILAIIKDPTVWKRQGHRLNQKNAKQLSLKINGALAMIIIVFYVLGNAVRIKFLLLP